MMTVRLAARGLLTLVVAFAALQVGGFGVSVSAWIAVGFAIVAMIPIAFLVGSSLLGVLILWSLVSAIGALPPPASSIQFGPGAWRGAGATDGPGRASERGPLRVSAPRDR